MAGVHFAFEDFRQLVTLNIGLSDRLDENRAESFTILYCDFAGFSNELIDSSIENILRESDSIVNHDKDYFFVLPYTDKYGANIVRNMFDVFFAKDIRSSMVSFPKDGESAKALIEELQTCVSVDHKNDLTFLDSY